MSKMHAPINVRRSRYQIDKKEVFEVKGLNYLLKHLKGLVVSDKYILDRNVLIMDVEIKTEKRMLSRAISSVIKDNNLVKINSLIRKGGVRNFRGTKGFVGSFKRMYMRFEREFDPQTLHTLGGGE